MQITINQLAAMNKEEIETVTRLTGYSMDHVAKMANDAANTASLYARQAENLTEEEKLFLSHRHDAAKTVLKTIGYTPPKRQRMISMASIREKMPY